MAASYLPAILNLNYKQMCLTSQYQKSTVHYALNEAYALNNPGLWYLY